MVNLQTPNLQLCQKISSTTRVFQLIYLPFKNTCFEENLKKKKSKNFEMQCIFCYARCVALHFQLLLLVRLTDPSPTFFETRMNRLIGKHLLSSAINKKERETWKVHRESTKHVAMHIVYSIWKEYENYNISLLMPE